MLKSLSVRDFILIDELNLDFDGGFNVITGETGAGKSIIINAIDIAFGAKTTKDVIKTGKERAFIELTVIDKNNMARPLLEQNGVEFVENEIIISKEITQTSSRSRVNGALVTQDFIKDLREILIDIHSQHQTYTYIQPKYHIHLLDAFSPLEHKELLVGYREKYRSLTEAQKKLEEAQNLCSQTEGQLDFLKFQVEEIESAQIENLSEDNELEAELEVLSNAQTLKELTYSSYWQLYGADENILNALNSIKANIARANDFDPNLSEIQGEFITNIENLREIASNLRNYAENTEPNQERIDQIEERIGVLDKLKRKYGGTLEEVNNSYYKMLDELTGITYSSDEVVRLEAEIKALAPIVEGLAQNLTQSRNESGLKLSELITQELEKLELPKSRFAVGIFGCEANLNGRDNVEFLITTNISEDLKPLAKVASGGEISRIMLAIKTIFANSDNVNTVIFDEIDAGVSGKASQAVADEILELSKSHQVITITHQPIIAARAPKHFYVTKSQEDTTQIKVYDLDEENKIKAIATLASGEITEDSLNFAKQLMSV